LNWRVEIRFHCPILADREEGRSQGGEGLVMSFFSDALCRGRNGGRSQGYLNRIGTEYEEVEY
jgi:hypothetical protein